MKKKISILWLTDIHFMGEYYEADNKAVNDEEVKIRKRHSSSSDALVNELLRQTDEYKEHQRAIGRIPIYSGKLDPFLSSFLTSIEDKKFDYIILSGDIAQSASEEDYKQFKIRILAELETRQPNATILTIPGNHDVLRKSIESKDLFSDAKSFKEKFKAKDDLLTNETDKFYDFFKNYSDFAKEIKLNESLIVDEKYQENRLFGHIRDEDKKIIFIMLNSAWFSFGSSINKHIVAAFKNLAENEHLNAKELVAEKGRQIIGRQLLDTDFITKLNKGEYKDYRVVTCMHHPLSWLEWGEQYTYEGNQTGFNLNMILDNSDLLLTGHDHLPLYVKTQKHSSNAWYLKGGVFLEQLKPEENATSEFLANCYGIIEIENNKAIYTKYKYKYDGPMSTWEKYEHSNNLPFEELLLEELKVIRKETIDVTSKSIIATLKSLDNYKEVSGIEKVKKVKKDAFLYHYISDFKGHFWILISPNGKEIDFYSKFKSEFKSEVNEKIMQILKENKEEKTVNICLFLPDISVKIDDEIKYRYENKSIAEKEAGKAYLKIVEEADRQMNVAVRHDIFADLTKEDNRDNKEMFEMYKDVHFVNDVIPFWNWK